MRYYSGGVSDWYPFCPTQSSGMDRASVSPEQSEGDSV